MRRVMVLALLLGAVRSAAAQTPFVFDGLVFGEADSAQVSDVYGVSLSCAQRSPRAQLCQGIGSVRRLEVMFVEGRLHMLRMLLPALAVPEEVVVDFKRRWGATVREGVGHAPEVADLRYWVFRPTDNTWVTLSEVRSRLSGMLRTRLMIIDVHGDWVSEAFVEPSV